jgi:hypothetical protein
MSLARVFKMTKNERYSLSDRIFIVKNWYSSGESPAVMMRKWSSAFKNRDKPSANTVKALIAKFEKIGTVADDTDSMKTKAKSARTPENVSTSREILDSEPSTSTRRLAQQLEVFPATAWRIARKDLGVYPYKIQVAQPLDQAAMEKRLEFANIMCDMINNGLDPDDIIFSDEAHFWLDGYVNRQNYRIWGTEKPELVVVRPLHPRRITVWCGLCGDGVLGPYFFDQTVNSERYYDFLANQYIPDTYSENWVDKYYFQQDGAPPQTTNDVLDLLRFHYGHRVIARNFPNRYGDGIA